MGNRKLARLTALLCAAFALTLPATVLAQGKIVCWKDKSGKVIGCGDKVPPEYQGSATKELDSRGVTRRTTESVEEANRRRTQEQEAVRLKAEEERKLLDQKRQDTALLETYSNEKEIDLKRDRDLQVLDVQIEQLDLALKSATQRHNEVKSRAEREAKSGKPMTAALKEELARAAADKERLEESVAAKQKEKEVLRARYGEYRKRYVELKNAQGAAPRKP